MQTTDELSPRQAAEVFTALRFWARATRYNAEEAERVLLAACESRSNRNWVLGAATGALAGLAVGLQLKQPRVQTASLAAIASTFGSLYGQYRANAPCLCDLLALGEAQESPLAEQARHIMRVGGAQTISALTRQRRQQQLAENDGVAAALAAHADGAADDDRRAAQRGAAIGHTARQSAPQFDDDEDVDAPARRRPAAQQADSWQAVRERYVDAPSGGGGSSWEEVGSGPPPPAGSSWDAVRAAPPAQTDSWEAVRGRVAAASAAPARRRRNAYGDEIVE